MKRFLRFASIGVILSVVFVLSGACTKKKEGATQFVTIGTGGITGVYYPTGGAIAKMINKKQDTYGIRASVEATGGSVYNINAVVKGDLEFGVAQSDRQYQALNGLAEWDSNPQKAFRSVCSFHREIITLVAADDSGIVDLKTMKGKRINIGNPGSGDRGNSQEVLRAGGIDWEKDIQAESLKASEAPKMLQDSRIDAFFFTVGHPSGTITEATSGRRKVHFVPIVGMETLLVQFPYYTKSRIGVKHYPMATNKADVESVAVVATLVTGVKVPENVVYAITKEVFENLEEFKTLHPAFGDLKKEEMLEGLSAPFHAGALKYYKEAGMKAD